MRTILVGLLLSFATMAAKSQAAPSYTDTAPPPSARFPADWYLPDDPNTYTEAPVKGVPYSATLVTTSTLQPSVSTPPDMRERRDPQYRDSMGRTRTEQHNSGAYKSVDGVLHYIPLVREINVNDPVSHCRFHWFEQPEIADPHPSAKVYCYSRVVQSAFDDPNAYIMKQEVHDDPGDTRFVLVRNEPLGKKEIGGFAAFGMRRIVSHRQDSPPTTRVLEVWYSPQLKELIWSGPVAPSPGDLRFEMQDIHLGEPSPDLFYPPSNFRIVFEKPYVRP